MKANRIPVADRLNNRINKLWASIRYGNHWSSRHFYPKCMYCERTNVECSIHGHRKGCRVTGVMNEIAHYQRLLHATTTPAPPAANTNQEERERCIK